MTSDGRGTIDGTKLQREQQHRRPLGRRFRHLPPAVTPVRGTDIAAGIAGQLGGVGRGRFRESIASLLDAEHAATYTSYRRALGVCLQELAETTSGRSTVLIPAFCSPDFRKTIEAVGLEYHRYDVEQATFAADPSAVETALDEDVLAVVAVNVLGYTSRMGALARTCEDAGVPLVEALGYALGTTYDGRPLGTFGDCAVCNFQQGKPIPVGGGMIVSQDPSLEVSDAGRPAVAPNLAALAGYAAFGRPRAYSLYRTATEHLDSWRESSERVTTHPGSKRNLEFAQPLDTMSHFQGIVGSRVLARNGEYQQARAETACYYRDALADCPGVRSVEPVDGVENHQHVRYPLVAETEQLRDELAEALRNAGVGSSNLYEWPPLDDEQTPAAAALKRTTLTLPTHPYVDSRDRRRIVTVVRRTVAQTGV